jgi:membrane-bound lytic murein transglycosylase D
VTIRAHPETMATRSWSFALAAVLLGSLHVGCGGSIPRSAVTTPPSVQPPPPPRAATPPVPAPDPIEQLISASQARFERGEAELQLGHLVRAKSEFNAALDLLLESPYGARSNARLQEHFDRLVDRISSHEIRALAEGDGFSEAPSEPASIDKLLDLSTFELPAPAAELKATVEVDLERTTHDIPIPLNGKVLAYIDLFQGRLRDWFQVAMQRGLQHLPMIQSTLKAEGLPLDLAFIPLVESAFQTNALSRAKAKGFWQFIASTGREHGLKTNWYVDERSDPEKATAAAAKYLAELRDAFKGDWHLAMASYNTGPGYVLQAIRKKGSADFWALAEKGRFLAKETKEYVPMILAAIVVGRNPTQYGFSFEPIAPPDYDVITVPSPVDLRRIAEWAQTSVDTVQELNPELRRWTTPLQKEGSEGYRLRVPKGTGEALQARLAEASPEELTTLQWYTVKRGESLTSIANKLVVRRADLADANNLTLRSNVAPGQKLVVPRAPTALLSAQPARPAPVADARPAATIAPPAASAPESRGVERPRTTYVVKRGDTLFSIAATFRTTVDALKALNRLRGDVIAPGDRIMVLAERRPGGGLPH